MLFTAVRPNAAMKSQAKDVIRTAFACIRTPPHVPKLTDASDAV